MRPPLEGELVAQRDVLLCSKAFGRLNGVEQMGMPAVPDHRAMRVDAPLTLKPVSPAPSTTHGNSGQDAARVTKSFVCVCARCPFLLFEYFAWTTLALNGRYSFHIVISR